MFLLKSSFGSVTFLLLLLLLRSNFLAWKMEPNFTLQAVGP